MSCTCTRPRYQVSVYKTIGIGKCDNDGFFGSDLEVGCVVHLMSK